MSIYEAQFQAPWAAEQLGLPAFGRDSTLLPLASRWRLIVTSNRVYTQRNHRVGAKRR